jgi:hypothetical protein
MLIESRCPPFFSRYGLSLVEPLASMHPWRFPAPQPNDDERLGLLRAKFDGSSHLQRAEGGSFSEHYGQFRHGYVKFLTADG